MHDITMNMNIGKARAIFDQIDSDKYTEDEKAVAIYIVMAMETKNSVTKESMVNAMRWMWNLLWKVDDIHTGKDGEV